jgi:hypothetical protein
VPGRAHRLAQSILDDSVAAWQGTVLRAVADAHCVDYHMASKSVAGGRWMGLTDTFCHHPLVHARGTIVIVIIIVIARMQSSSEIAAWGTMQNLRREACASGCIR